MPEKGGWPYSGGEIDILEARDNADEAYQTYHHGKCWRADGAGTLEALTYWDAQGAELAIEPALCNAQSSSCVASYRAGAALAKNPPGACAERFALRTYQSVQISLGHTQKARALQPFHLQDHVFAVEWTPARLDYYVGAERTHTVAVGSVPTKNYATGGGEAALPPAVAALGPHNFPTSPFYYILNHSTWVRPERRAAFQPQRVLIDYVKAYSACTTDAELCPCGGTFAEGKGCALGGRAPACAPGGASPAVRGGTYPSPGPRPRR